MIRLWLGVDFMTFLTTRQFFSQGIFSRPQYVAFQYDICSYSMLQPFSATQEVSEKAIEIFHYCRVVQLSKHFLKSILLIGYLANSEWQITC